MVTIYTSLEIEDSTVHTALVWVKLGRDNYLFVVDLV